MNNNTYMIIEENDTVLVQKVPWDKMLALVSLLTEYAPEVRDYTIVPDYFEYDARERRSSSECP